MMEVYLALLTVPVNCKISDLFIDGQEVMQELNITERTLRHYRTTGKISYTDRFGKIFYFKLEILKLLFDGRKCKKVNKTASDKGGTFKKTSCF